MRIISDDRRLTILWFLSAIFLVAGESGNASAADRTTDVLNYASILVQIASTVQIASEQMENLSPHSCSPNGIEDPTSLKDQCAVLRASMERLDQQMYDLSLYPDKPDENIRESSKALLAFGKALKFSFEKNILSDPSAGHRVVADLFGVEVLPPRWNRTLPLAGQMLANAIGALGNWGTPWTLISEEDREVILEQIKTLFPEITHIQNTVEAPGIALIFPLYQTLTRPILISKASITH